MKSLIEEKIARKQKALTWTEPELIELNAHLRDIAEGYCAEFGAIAHDSCGGGSTFSSLEDCNPGTDYVWG